MPNWKNNGGQDTLRSFNVEKVVADIKKIYGCYIDIYDKPQKTYLAESYKEAKRRAPIEKTFLYPTRYELQHSTYYEL